MVTLHQIRHFYQQKKVLDIEAFQAEAGQQWLVEGLSGSGKTTLLHILAAILKPTHGSVHIDGTDLNSLTAGERDRFRGNQIGIVFQQLHLLPSLTALQNLLMVPYLSENKISREDAIHLLEQLEMADYLQAFPHQLSMGQRQRVAIARALVNRPKLILADEPTASLDGKRCDQMLHLLLKQAADCDATLIVTSHDQRIKEAFQQTLSLDPEGGEE